MQYLFLHDIWMMNTVPHSVHHPFPFSHPLSQEAAALWYERQILIIIIIRVHVI